MAPRGQYLVGRCYGTGRPIPNTRLGDAYDRLLAGGELELPGRSVLGSLRQVYRLKIERTDRNTYRMRRP